MRHIGFILATVLATGLVGCGGEEDDYEVVEGFEDDGDGKADSAWGLSYVGSPTDYDPGPSIESGWAELFASIPNYRAVSAQLGAEWLTPDKDGTTKLDRVNAELVAAGKPEIPALDLTNDKFRYHMGPVFYRGRLDGTARVLVVGQDAATDEAMVHRAFVGGTGQKVQGLLDQIGITRSYLCLNTFTYSIFGQYDAFADELATSGPIADHRSEMFEYAYRTNQLQLILSFGNGAHKSVQLWLDTMHDGKVPAGVYWLRLLHPGMASFAYDQTDPDGSSDPTITKAVMDSFGYGWNRVWTKRKYEPTWLAPDPDGMQSRKSKYYYANFAIPYRDLPYGAPADLGHNGTATERGSNLRVQLHSVNGVRYTAPYVNPLGGATRTYSGLELADGELAWEPPKFDSAVRHDRGPGAAWAELFADTPAQETIAAEAGVTIANDFAKPVWYRGKLDGTAHVLVIAQNTSVDAFIGGRTLVADEGQHIQHLLRTIGAEGDTIAITPYPFLTARLAPGELDRLTTAPSLIAMRDRILDKILDDNDIQLVLTFGSDAEQAFAIASQRFTGTWVRMDHPTATGAYKTWNAGLAAIEAARQLPPGTYPLYLSSKFGTSRVGVPREELPWGKPMWFGTSGNLSQQADASWIFWNAPRWLSSEPIDG